MRHGAIVLALGALAVLLDQRGPGSDRASGRSNGHNVILVVSDGLRWQEVFRGADSSIVFGSPDALGGDAGAVRQKYWRPSVTERRATLMPFVWGTMARQGRLLGNRDLDSRVDVTNAMRFSYPGYNEMLVGYPDARIDRNDYGPNPNVTVFEWLNRRRDFRGRVAAFGNWDVFRDIFNVERSRIHIYTTGSSPHDALVHRNVLPYLKQQSPRALFVAYAETDDWAHEGRYDRFLKAVQDVDRYLAELWGAVQAHPSYRGKTTLIFTADHGRGRTAADWRHHGKDVAGAEETFVVMIGPAAGAATERRGTRHVLGQVAATAAAALGLRYEAAPCAKARRLTCSAIGAAAAHE